MMDVCDWVTWVWFSIHSPLNTPKKETVKRLNPETPPSQRKRKKVDYTEPPDIEDEDEDEESEELDDEPTEEEIAEALSESKNSEW